MSHRPTAWARPPPSAQQVQGREVWLVHPWSLGDAAAGAPEGTLLLGLYLSDFHRAWPWNECRWRFVGERMAQVTAHRWHGDAASVRAALAGAARVRWQEDPHLAPWLSGWAEAVAVPELFPPVAQRCDSFSRWWSRVGARGREVAWLGPP